MSIGTVGITGPGAAAALPPSGAVRGESKGNDHDADEAGRSVSPAKSVNLDGQATGSLVHSVA